MKRAYFVLCQTCGSWEFAAGFESVNAWADMHALDGHCELSDRCDFDFIALAAKVGRRSEAVRD
jgi:hypothetical protein